MENKNYSDLTKLNIYCNKQAKQINILLDKLHNRNVQIKDLKKRLVEAKAYKPTLSDVLKKLVDRNEELAECEKEQIDILLERDN